MRKRQVRLHLYGEAVGERPRRGSRAQPPELFKKIVDPLADRLARAKNPSPFQGIERPPPPRRGITKHKITELPPVRETASLTVDAGNRISPCRAQFPPSLLRKIDEGLATRPDQFTFFKQVARSSPGRMLGGELKRYLQQRAVLSPAEARAFGEVLGSGSMDFAAFHRLLNSEGETLSASSHANIFGLPQFNPERVKRAATEARRRPACEVAGVSQGVQGRRDTFPDVQPSPSSPMFATETDRLQRGDVQRATFQAEERRVERERLQRRMERLGELPHLRSTLTLA